MAAPMATAVRRQNFHRSAMRPMSAHLALHWVLAAEWSAPEVPNCPPAEAAAKQEEERSGTGSADREVRAYPIAVASAYPGAMSGRPWVAPARERLPPRAPSLLIGATAESADHRGSGRRCQPALHRGASTRPRRKDPDPPQRRTPLRSSPSPPRVAGSPLAHQR
jgi:hypothetical protein